MNACLGWLSTHEPRSSCKPARVDSHRGGFYLRGSILKKVNGSPDLFSDYKGLAEREGAITENHPDSQYAVWVVIQT